MRRNVACTAWVAVVVPRSANVVAFFEEEKRIHPCFAEFYGHAQAGKAAADNENVNAQFFRVSGWLRCFGHRQLHHLARRFRVHKFVQERSALTQ